MYEAARGVGNVAVKHFGAVERMVSGEREALAYGASPAAPLGLLDPTVDVSVIIVNWNTWELLRDCLASLYENAGATRIEVIVVDNASSDGSPDMVRRAFPQAQLLVNQRNMGFAAANNQGLAAAHGR